MKKKDESCEEGIRWIQEPTIITTKDGEEDFRIAAGDFAKFSPEVLLALEQFISTLSKGESLQAGGEAYGVKCGDLSACNPTGTGYSCTLGKCEPVVKKTCFIFHSCRIAD
ncbi:MAG: hypothetical protein ACUZ77_08700 [Candidatus Brocadiales bacterium]